MLLPGVPDVMTRCARILPRVRTNRDQIEAIAKNYAETLMTPAAEVRGLVDGTVEQPMVGPTVAPVPIWSRESLP